MQMYRSISLSVLLWWQRISTELIDAFSMAKVSTICGLRGERIQTALWKPPHWKAGNYTLHMPTPDALDKFLNILQGQLCDFLFDFQCTKHLWKGGPFRIKSAQKCLSRKQTEDCPWQKQIYDFDRISLHANVFNSLQALLLGLYHMTSSSLYH